MLRASFVFSAALSDAGQHWNASQILPQMSAVSNRIAVYSVNSFMYVSGGAAEEQVNGFVAFKNSQVALTNAPSITFVPTGYCPACSPFFWSQEFEIEMTIPKQGVVTVPTVGALIVNLDFEFA
jgi:hypothetical protein